MKNNGIKREDVQSIIEKAKKLGGESNRSHLNKAAHGSWRNQLSYVFGMPMLCFFVAWFASTWFVIMSFGKLNAGGLAAMLASGPFLVTIASIAAATVLGFLIASGWNAWNLSCERARIRAEKEDTPCTEDAVNELRQKIDGAVNTYSVSINEEHTSEWLQRYSRESLEKIDDATVLSDYVYLINYKRYRDNKSLLTDGYARVFSKPGNTYTFNDDWKEKCVNDLKAYCRSEGKRIERQNMDMRVHTLLSPAWVPVHHARSVSNSNNASVFSPSNNSPCEPNAHQADGLRSHSLYTTPGVSQPLWLKKEA